MEAIFIILTAQALLSMIGGAMRYGAPGASHLPSGQPRYLALRTARRLLMALILFGLAWWQWQGVFAWVLGMLIILETALLVRPVLISREKGEKLPFRQVLLVAHVMSGVSIAVLFVPVLLNWSAMNGGLISTDHGLWSRILTGLAAGFAIATCRGVVATMRRTIERIPEWQLNPIRRGERNLPRTWLISGGTGFVGRRLVHRLIARGDNIIVIARDPAKASHMYGPHVRIAGSAEDIDDCERVDVMVSLSGTPFADGLWSRARRDELLRSRIEATDALVALAGRLKRPPGLLIGCSDVGYYGDQTGDELTENSAPGTGFIAELWRAVEDSTRKAEAFGVRVVRLRLGQVIDPDGGGLKAQRAITRFPGGLIPGDGRQMGSWISLDDLIGLMFHAEERTRMNGAVNAVAPEPDTRAGMARLIAESMNRPVLLKLPAWLIRGLFGDRAGIWLGNTRVRPVQAEKTGYRFTDRTLAAALQQFETDAEPVPVDAVTFFNMDCPVCSTEARMCQRQIDQISEPTGLDLVHLKDRPDLLAPYGLKAEHLSRRLYIIQADGRSFAGIDALIRTWQRIPAYRWRARLASLPGAYLVACFLYESAIAPLVDGMFGINSHRARRRATDMPRIESS